MRLNSRIAVFAFLIALAISSYVSAESGVVAFQSSALVSTPLYRTWNETGFSGNLNATNVTSTIRWVVLKNNPTRREQILGTLDSNSHLKIQFYNWTGWSQTYNMTITAGVATMRSFNIAVEQSSGNVIVAYNNGTAGMIAYQVWNGTGWFASGSAAINGTGQVNWIKMASRPYSNQTLLIAADANSDLDALTWNGSAFSTSKNLETSLETAAKEPFDVVYENSGDALAVWANSATATPKYANYSSGTWSATANGPASAGQTAVYQWFRLKDYPNTDRIMMCSMDSTADLNCAEWTGNNWGTISELTAAAEYSSGDSWRNFEIMPDTSSNSFFVMYGANGLNYYSSRRCFGTANCQAGTWEAAQTFLSGVDIGTDTAWAQMDYDPENSGQITAVMTDQTATGNQYLARITCSNSANSCAAAQTSTLLAVSSNSDYESAMFRYQGVKPRIDNVTTSSIQLASTTMTVTAAGVNDLNNNTLYMYCSTIDTQPTSSTTICTGGNTTVNEPYAGTSCSYTSQSIDGAYKVYCRIYDGNYYSGNVSASYTIDSTPPTTTIASVAGDTAASYYDLVNDGRTDIIVNGESGMSCRWSASDLAYSGMSSACLVTGTQANCSVNDVNVATEGFKTRYIACSDTAGNGQNSTQNLNVDFYVDYNAPTTSDNSTSEVHVPAYTVTITESDAVDTDPTTYYCTSSTEGCSPTTPIDNGGQISYTTANRGANYLRYYSTDDAGWTQTTVNKTININQLPVMSSAADDAVTIKGGFTVNVSTVSYDLDSSQTLKLFVCNSTGATHAGCTNRHYCNATGNTNISCTFTAETDSASHTWYAYMFDELNESAASNPLSGSYTTDSTGPSIVIVTPVNGTTYTQSAMTFTIVVNEALTNAFYSLNGSENRTLSNTSVLVWTATNSSIGDGSYSIMFYANDTYGNLANSSAVSFTINTAGTDTTPPTITIWSPTNATYYITASTFLNITMNENAVWTGYSNNSGSTVTMVNVTGTNWNTTVDLPEGRNNLTFYANDSSGNKGNSSIHIYVDLTNPSTDSFACYPSTANNSQDITCNGTASDAVGLNYVIIEHNATGTWQNSSQISLAGTSSFSYTIAAGNTTMPGFTAKALVYDLSGRANMSLSSAVIVNDDTYPTIGNISYTPNTTTDLDPGVTIVVIADISEDYLLSNATLMYKNSSSSDWTLITMTNTTAVRYDANFTAQNETWYFQIKATASYNNQRISSNYTLSVANDTEQNITTNIPLIKSIVYADRAGNSSMGYLILNNTGETALTINVTLSASSITSRLSVNYTSLQTASYSVGNGTSLNITIDANTSTLTAALYDYTITIASAAGTVTYSKYLNIQTASGAYLSTSIGTYSSSVTKGQTGVQLAATVTNLGTADATGVTLDWTLPSEFTLASGSLSRSIGNLAIGSSASNTITVDVSSTSADKNVNITATASSTNADSTSDTKQTTIGTPTTITETTTVTTTTSTGGGSTGGTTNVIEKAEFSKIIEIVRGKEDSFDLKIENRFSYPLEDMEIGISGYLSKYITVKPRKISNIAPGQKGIFQVTIKVPEYKETYEEQILTALIKGYIAKPNKKQEYQETQNIKLIIQDISFDESNVTLTEAEQAIAEMKHAGYNTDDAQKLLNEAIAKLKDKKNKEAYTIAELIKEIKAKAFYTDNHIRLVADALKNPRKVRLLGNENNVKDYSGDKIRALTQILTDIEGITSSSNMPFTSFAIMDQTRAEVTELVSLAVAAFERGDYGAAETRIISAEQLLMLEFKGNAKAFVYFYWWAILIALMAVIISGVIGTRQYKKTAIKKKIRYIGVEEDNIRELMRDCQKRFFSAKISESQYLKEMTAHNDRLAKLKQKRIKLRNRRIKLLSPEKVINELETERKEVEDEIKKIQKGFYVAKDISEEEYKMDYEILNQRLAEIENENVTLELMRGHKR